ncbi:hypothetical protein Q9189_003383 [Teloschistes chrysophthalmus]
MACIRRAGTDVIPPEAGQRTLATGDEVSTMATPRSRPIAVFALIIMNVPPD